MSRYGTSNLPSQPPNSKQYVTLRIVKNEIPSLHRNGSDRRADTWNWSSEIMQFQILLDTSLALVPFVWHNHWHFTASDCTANRQPPLPRIMTPITSKGLSNREQTMVDSLPAWTFISRKVLSIVYLSIKPLSPLTFLRNRESDFWYEIQCDN